jgi:hypothetical protein
MWLWIKRIILGLLLLLAAGFLHYTLPDRDIVRIVGADVKRTNIGSGWFWAGVDTGTGDNQSRDVRFINAIRANGRTIVYRNEDTGWGWPPYFKFNSADLSAQAESLVSDEKTPIWVAVRHYGWRNAWFAIYPNATSMKVVSGPDVRLIPWFNIVFLTLLFGGLLALYRLFVLWRRRRIDPTVARVGDALEDGVEAVGDATEKQRKRLMDWFRRS